ncbi:MAG: FliM/FliN family flagellar motor switch protein, partial [Acetobacteraceae bacterium]
KPAAGQGMRALVADGASSQPKLPMLAGVVDRLAASVAISFRTISRGAADARTDEPRPIRLAEFTETIPPTALIAVLRIGAWNGPCLAVIDRDLANTAAGLMLGARAAPVPGPDGGTASGTGPASSGPSSGPASGPRDYTAIERTVLERLARDLIAGNLARSFAEIVELDVSLDRMAGDAADTAIAKPRAPCLTWRIAVTMDEREGAITFLLPYASVEPIRALLSRNPSGAVPGRDPAWHTHLGAELPHAGMKVRAVIERRRVAATEILRWRIGSTIVLNHRQDEPVEVFCDDLLVLRARMAEQDGRVALHVDERRLAEDWPAQT